MPDITLASAATSGFIPQAWALRALDVLRANLVLAKLVTRDTDFAPGWKGQTLNIPYPGTFTAQDKLANTAATVQAPTGSSVPITLNKHKYVDFIVEDVAQAQANTSLMDRYTEPAVVALAEQLEADLFAQYTGFAGSVGTSGTPISAATLRTLSANMTDARMPAANRNLIITAQDQMSLLSDTSLAQYFAYAKSMDIGAGQIASGLYGFNIFVSQLVPKVAGTPPSNKNLAFNPLAVMLAMRPFTPPPANSGVDAFSISDPVSGLAIRVVHQYDVANRGIRIGFDILYGSAVIRPAFGYVVLS